MAWADATDPDARATQVPIDGDDLADLMYTSGTTGRPKGVVVRHRNVAMVPNGLPRWSGAGWLHASPMFTFAGIASTYNPMKLGLRLLYLPRFDADAWFDVVEQRRPSATFLVPAMAELLIASPRFETADLTSITICPIGSAPLSPATLQRLQAKLPNAMVSNMGTALTTMAFTEWYDVVLTWIIGSVAFVSVVATLGAIKPKLIWRPIMAVPFILLAILLGQFERVRDVRLGHLGAVLLLERGPFTRRLRGLRELHRRKARREVGKPYVVPILRSVLGFLYPARRTPYGADAQSFSAESFAA